MGVWSEQVVPRAADVVLGTEDVARFRREVAASLAGVVLEIGFGSGLSLAAYSQRVRAVLAVEPSPVARRLASERIRSSTIEVEFVGLDAQELPLGSASVDAALTTFTLCTVPDPQMALHELRRVLRPGGKLHFLEHGLSTNDAIARWQRRLTPLQRRVAGGCHLDRPIGQLVSDAGFTLDALRNDQLRGPRPVRPFGYLYIGTATKATTEPTTSTEPRCSPS